MQLVWEPEVFCCKLECSSTIWVLWHATATAAHGLQCCSASGSTFGNKSVYSYGLLLHYWLLQHFFLYRVSQVQLHGLFKLRFKQGSNEHKLAADTA